MAKDNANEKGNDAMISGKNLTTDDGVNKNVLIGCVTFKGHMFVLDEFLAALRQQTYQGFDLVIVDNSETEDYADTLRSKGLTVIRDVPGTKSRIQRITSGREKTREMFLSGKWQYLFFVDSDIIIPPDALERLLSHEADIISGVCLCRINLGGKMEIHPALYDFAGKGQGRLMDIEEVAGDELQEIDVCGFGCCLVKRIVVERVPLRYYEKSAAGEDVAFNVDAHKFGFRTFVDKSVKCRHVTPTEILEVPKGISPTYDEVGQYSYTFTVR